MTSHRLMYACAALLMLSSGCTLLYGAEADQRQCEKASDCDKLARDETKHFVCAKSVCAAVECTDDAHCPTGACNTANNLCEEVDAGPVAKACSKDSDCTTTERCSPKDGLCYEKWGCLDTASDWLDSENIKSEFSYQAVMRSLQGPDDPSLLGEVKVTACTAADIPCDRPKVSPDQVTITADKHITVPFRTVGLNGFVGVVRVEAAVPAEDQVFSDAGVPKEVLPGIFQFTGENPLVTDTIAQNRAIMIDTATSQVLAGASGVDINKQGSNTVFLIYDCGGNNAPDVKIDVVDATGYSFIPLADEQTPAFGKESTQAFGTAFVANVPDGFQTFVMKDVKLNKTISESFSFNVLKGGINYVQYYPRYSALKKWLDYAKQNPSKVP